MVEDLINFNFDNVEGSSNQISKEWFDRYPLIDNDESTHYSDHIPQNKKRLLKKFGWVLPNGKDRALRYKIYEYGFRTPLTDKPSVVFIGCSNTFGTALNLEQTFSYKVAESLNLPLVNLGIPGASFDQTYRILKTFLSRLNPKYVFCLIPDATRSELITTPTLAKTAKNHTGREETVMESINLHTYAEKETGLSRYVDYVRYLQKSTLVTLENQLSNYNRNLDALKYICKDTNLITIPTLKYFTHKEKLNILKNYGKARDLSHFGEPWHDIVTKDFLNQVS